MADPMRTLDRGLPDFTRYETTEAKLDALVDYMTMHTEELRYLLRHLDERNFSDERQFVSSDSAGEADGVATLDDNGRVPASQLPPYPIVPSAYGGNPAMDGTASPGSTGLWADGGHVHPTDTSRASAGIKINGHALTDDITLDAADVGAVPSTDKGAAGGVASLDSGGKVPAAQLPAYPVVPGASTANPAMDGTADPGSTGDWADGGHVHPTDTTRAAAALEINGHALTGDFDLTAADVGAAPAKSVLRFTSVAVSAGTSQQIISISNADITADYVLARIEWADPSYITAGYTWTTGAGSFTLSGTATAATTANVVLIRKGN